MTWATAVGLAGGGVGVLALMIGFLMLVNRAYQRGEDALEARTAQLEAEHLRRAAEDDRDEAHKQLVVKSDERDRALAALTDREHQLAAAEQTILGLRKATIDAADGKDLVDAARAVLSRRP
jgi:nitric oxide reductase large subunit